MQEQKENGAAQKIQDGDIREYLTTRIEAEVRKQKNEAPLTLGLPVAFTGSLESTGE